MDLRFKAGGVVGVQSQQFEVAVVGGLPVADLNRIDQQVGKLVDAAVHRDLRQHPSEDGRRTEYLDPVAESAEPRGAPPDEFDSVQMVGVGVSEDDPVDPGEVDVEFGALPEDVGAEVHERVGVDQVGAAAPQVPAALLLRLAAP